MRIIPIILLSTLALINAQENLNKKVVCYYTNWSAKRKGEYNFTPKDIDPFLCTHVIYSFLTFKEDLSGIKSGDTNQDIIKKGFEQFTALKNLNPKLKLLAAIGGWAEGSKRFSNVAAFEKNRRSFAQGCAKFLRKENFDGINIDWLFPGIRDGSRKEDVENLPKLLKTIREVFDAETNGNKLLVTLSVHANTGYIDKGFDLPRLQKYADFMTILCYDYHSSTDIFVNHHSQIYALPGEDELTSKLNMDWTINYILKKGLPKEKLVVGIPAYGRSFTLEDENMHGLGSFSAGEGAEGTETKESGSKAFYEICNDVIRNGWIVERVNETAVGPYAHKGKEWIGYDDEKSAKRKGEYARDHDLGGIMFWAIDFDDFKGKCGNGKNPLIKAAKEGFYSQKPKTNSSLLKPKSNTTTRKPKINMALPKPVIRVDDDIVTEKITPKMSRLFTQVEEMIKKPIITTNRELTQGGNTYYQSIWIANNIFNIEARKSTSDGNYEININFN